MISWTCHFHLTEMDQMFAAVRVATYAPSGSRSRISPSGAVLREYLCAMYQRELPF